MPRKAKLVASEPIAAKENGMEATIFNQEGKKVGSVSLPEQVFGARWNPDLVHQVVTVMQGNARIPYAHTKDRSEVRGGGKKPWRQKGTGRARHGSSRSPIWRGGGITFGPRKEKIFTRSLNKNVRVQALYCVLSRKFKDGKIVFVDTITFSEIKTKNAKKVMETLFDKAGQKKKNAILIALPSRNEVVEKSFQNFGNVMVDEVRNLNPVVVLKHTYLAIVDPDTSLPILTARSRKSKLPTSKS